MKLTELKDTNGTSLNSHVNFFVEKCIECGVRVVIALRSTDVTDPRMEMRGNVDPDQLGRFFGSSARMAQEPPSIDPVTSSN